MLTKNYSTILLSLFQTLEENNSQYVVLRGFEKLPKSYSNDIDFGVLKEDLPLFIKTVEKIGLIYLYELKVRDLRLDVLKLSLNSTVDNIDIDIWSSFNYAGLSYLDHENILKNYSYHNNIKVLKPENELALSYLKELLHMNRIREEKVLGLQNKLKSPYHIPLNVYFPNRLIEEFISSIEEEEFKLKVLSTKAKIILLVRNIEKNGFRRTVFSIYRFIRIRILRNSLVKKTQKLIINKDYNSLYE